MAVRISKRYTEKICRRIGARRENLDNSGINFISSDSLGNPTGWEVISHPSRWKWVTWKEERNHLAFAERCCWPGQVRFEARLCPRKEESLSKARLVPSLMQMKSAETIQSIGFSQRSSNPLWGWRTTEPRRAKCSDDGQSSGQFPASQSNMPMQREKPSVKRNDLEAIEWISTSVSSELFRFVQIVLGVEVVRNGARWGGVRWRTSSTVAEEKDPVEHACCPDNARPSRFCSLGLVGNSAVDVRVIVCPTWWALRSFSVCSLPSFSSFPHGNWRQDLRDAWGATTQLTEASPTSARSSRLPSLAQHWPGPVRHPGRPRNCLLWPRLDSIRWRISASPIRDNHRVQKYSIRLSK